MPYDQPAFIYSTNAHLAVPPEPRVILVAALEPKFLFLSPTSEKACLFGAEICLSAGLLNTHENYSGQFGGSFKWKKLRRNPWNWRPEPTRGRELALSSNVLRTKD